MTSNSTILLKILQGNPGEQPNFYLPRRYNTFPVIYELSVNQHHVMLVPRNSRSGMDLLVVDWPSRCNNRFAKIKMIILCRKGLPVPSIILGESGDTTELCILAHGTKSYGLASFAICYYKQVKPKHISGSPKSSDKAWPRDYR